MSELFLVRHAQASFGEGNYDRLSPLGHQQARWLGEYFKFRGLRFDTVICGDMVRHRETLEGISSGMEQGAPVHSINARWNEFDFETLIAVYLSEYPEERPKSDAPAQAFSQLLRRTLIAWTEDRLGQDIPESWAEFGQRVQEALSQATQGAGRSSKTLVLSSGGAISMALGQVLKTPPGSVIQMNIQTRNSSFSHLFFNHESISLSGFNHIPHLDHPERGHAVTYF